MKWIKYILFELLELFDFILVNGYNLATILENV